MINNFEMNGVPQINGYIVHSIWTQQKGTRGQGGVVCIYKEAIQDLISIAKDDTHKWYVWIEIKGSNIPFFWQDVTYLTENPPCVVIKSLLLTKS